jgi:proline iminopeptidase
VHGPAAVAWATWEASAITLLPRPELVASFADPGYALAFARIENHYFVNHGWMTEGQLIANVDAIRGIPGVIIQGRYDLCTPAVTAWELHQAWPEAELRMIDDAGHAFDEPGILDALIEATDRFAS